MKPGTLVMKIRHSSAITSILIPIGLIGEIVESNIVDVGKVAVKWPIPPPDCDYDYWQSNPSNLIAISDPDADISDTYEQPIKNKETV